MATLVGIEPNMMRVKISYPEPLDDRAMLLEDSGKVEPKIVKRRVMWHIECVTKTAPGLVTLCCSTYVAYL